jgi:aldehyde dehydrogenase (NAD+)
VFVPESKQAELVEGFRKNVEANLYPEGKLDKSSIAQIVNKANFDRVKAMVDDAVAKGASVAVGGQMDADDLTIHPTMLTHVTPQMRIMQDEIFAPVLPVMSYDKPLALYMFSPSEENMQRVLQRTSAGGTTLNGVFSHYLENRLPFGGVNGSGTGSYHGYWGFRAFSHERAVYRHMAPA